MGTEALIGASLLSFALPLALFGWIVSSSAKLVILMVGSAFMWLLSALVSSVIWTIFAPLKPYNAFPLVVGVLMQEIFRFLYWKVLKRAEDGLDTLADDGSGRVTYQKQAMVAGLGFGVMSSIMQVNNVLNESAGPGTLPAPGCTSVSVFTIAALTTACFGCLNICWSVIMHAGLDKAYGLGVRSNVGLIAGNWQCIFVVVSHYGASLLTLANGGENGCTTTLVPLYIFLFVTLGLAWRSSGLRIKRA